MKVSKFYRFFAMLLVLMLLTTACGKQEQTQTEGEPGSGKSKIIIAQASDALVLDPQQQNEGPTNSVLINLYDGLVNMKPDMSIEEGLATSWEQKDDLTWVFHLREGVKFHNGKDFTADDVIFTIERCRDQLLSNFVAMIDEVEKIDEYTVQMKTVKPYAILLEDLAKVFIISKDYVTEVGDEEFNLNPVGTGPYKFVEWMKEDHITLEANEDYWNGAPEIKTVIFRPISNEATRTAALLSGEVDLITDVPARDVDRIGEKANVIKEPSLMLLYLTLDVTRDKTPGVDLTKNPLKDDKVKQAIRLGIDIDSIVKNVMANHGYPADQANPKGVYGYVEDIERPACDPEKAKQLLAEAGYPDGFSIKLDGPNNRYPNDYKVAEAVASQLAKIGIDVELNLMPKSVFFDYVRPGDKSSFVLVGWATDNADAGSWYKSMFYTRDKKEGYGTSNRCHYANPEFDELIEKSDDTADINERDKYLQEASRILDKELPMIPLFFFEDIYGIKEGFEFTPRKDACIYAYDIKLK